MRVKNLQRLRRQLVPALSLVLLAGLPLQPTSGHGIPILVRIEATCQQLWPSQSEAGQFVLADGEIATTSPSIGVTFPAGGPAVGTALGLETLGGLLYYADGVQPTAASVVIEGPVIDVFGTPVVSEVGEYIVDNDSPPQSGMTWGVYDGRNFWDADGYFTLNPTTAASGIYGVPVRLTGDPYLPSEPFMLPWVFDPGDELTETVEETGIAALRDLVTATYRNDYDGDFDADGDHDGRDFLIWQTTGDPAGLCRWQRRYGDPSPVAEAAARVPEPASVGFAASCLLIYACWRRSFRRNATATL